MKIKIYFELIDGSQDSIILEGETVEELQRKAAEEMKKRNVLEAWSEEIR